MEMDTTRTDAYQPLSVRELFALALPERVWIVDRLLWAESVTLFSAREKAGKGLLSIDLLASVAFGEPFLGRATMRAPVVYLAAEESVELLRERIAARLGHRQDRDDGPFYVLPLDGFTADRLRLDDPDNLQKLANMIVALQPGVVVFDTLRELHDRPEDSADEMSSLLRPIRQMARQERFAAVVNHHQNKGNTYRGSTSILAALDQEWSFQRADGGDPGAGGAPRGRLTVNGRVGGKQILSLRLGEGLRWETTDDPGGHGGRTTLRDRILALLAERGGWLDAKEMAEALEVSQGAVMNALAGLVAERPAPMEGTGSGGRHDPRRYRWAGTISRASLPGGLV